jgi:hypothetical protein
MEHEVITAPRGAFWAASAFSKLIDAIDGGIHFITDQFREHDPLGRAASAQDVINYANSIRHTDPSFAGDLIAAVNRSEDGL